MKIMREIDLTKKHVSRIIEESIEKELFSEYNDETKAKVLDDVRAEVTKLKKPGKLDDFIAGWDEIIDERKGMTWEFSVYFTVGVDIHKVTVVCENGYDKLNK